MPSGTSTTIKVPTILRDRIAVRAKEKDTTLAGAIEDALNAAEDAQFWTQVQQTMLPGEGVRHAEKLSGSLKDRGEPEEWNFDDYPQ